MSSKTHTKFDDFDISLYHLVYLGNSIQNLVDAFSNIIDKVELEHERRIYVAVYSLITIQTCSFLDEFKNIKSLDDPRHETILALRKAVKPAIKEIEKWEGMRDCRNTFLAHNMRNAKDNNLSVFEDGIEKFDTPKTGFDLMVLQNCIKAIIRAFELKFSDRLITVQSIIDNEKAEAAPHRFPTEKEAYETVQRIFEEINANLHRSGVFLK
jgi:hypothetical protein